MHKNIFFSLLSLLFALSLFFIPNSYAADNKDIAGIWQGKLKFSGKEISIVINIKESGGKLTSTIDSPDQNVMDIPVENITFEKDSLKIESNALVLVFEGKLKSNTIEGEWKQRGVNLPLTLTKTVINAADNCIAGIWQGKLKFNGKEITIVINIKATGGKLISTIDSPDQSVTGIPVESVTFAQDSLKVESKTLALVFEGKLKADTIEGEWKQRGITLPLSLTKTDKAFVINRPQEPKPPYTYNEEEVVFENKKDKIKLAGTLTYPKTNAEFPAVVMITGSGPEDRNETVFGHKPFLIIADYLTRNGIAVLRFDDRGVGKSEGKFETALTTDFATDAIAAVEYLKTRKEINSSKIGLIGHSEGGIVAPMVASQNSDVAFIVLMAGTGITGEEIICKQGELIARADGEKEENIAKGLEHQKKLFNILKTEKDEKIMGQKLKELIKSNPEAKSMTDQDIEMQVKATMTPWFIYFLTYDPKPALLKVKCPVLAINGEKDLQVPCKENLAEIEKALKQGGNKNYTIKALPDLNHLFQKATTGSPSEYGKIEETVNPEALKVMAEWILKTTK